MLTEAAATLAAQRQAAAVGLRELRKTRDDYRRWASEQKYKRRVWSRRADDKQRQAQGYRLAMRDLGISRPATGKE